MIYPEELRCVIGGYINALADALTWDNRNKIYWFCEKELMKSFKGQDIHRLIMLNKAIANQQHAGNQSCTVEGIANRNKEILARNAEVQREKDS